MQQELPQKGTVPVEPEEVMPLFGQLFTRSIIKELLQQLEPEQGMYWRILTPLVVMWGLIYQRLNRDHSCDAFVSHLRSGGADRLDNQDPHDQPLSQRLRSENNAGYVQGRNRLPLALLQKAQQLVTQEAQQIAGEQGRWQGLTVRLIDGTTFSTPPEGDLPASYQPITSRHGPVHWLKVRSVLACDYFTQAVVGLATMSFHNSEQEMVPQVVAQDPQPGSLYLGDQNFGVYSVAQAISKQGHHVLLRLKRDRAQALCRRQPDPSLPHNGQSRAVVWTPTRRDQPFEQWPADPIPGRLIYLQITQAGFRPTELYLFTTLLDEAAYPALALAALYRQRGNVELYFRHVKQSLELDFFDVRSVALFQRELAAGILAYNLICILLLQAALRVQLLPAQLSFKRCMRRIHSTLTSGVPVWVKEEQQVAEYLLDRLAACRLPNQPNKVKHEPRKVRRRGSPYPPLHGDRTVAREEVLKNLKGDTKS